MIMLGGKLISKVVIIFGEGGIINFFFHPDIEVAWKATRRGGRKELQQLTITISREELLIDQIISC